MSNTSVTDITMALDDLKKWNLIAKWEQSPYWVAGEWVRDGLWMVEVETRLINGQPEYRICQFRYWNREGMDDNTFSQSFPTSREVEYRFQQTIKFCEVDRDVGS